MNLKVIAFICLLVAGVSCEDEEELEEFSIVLTDDSFKETIASNNFFVMFYAPW